VLQYCLFPLDIPITETGKSVSNYGFRDQCLTPKIPEDCPEKLRELMQMCWKKEPEQRPVSFYLSVFFDQTHTSKQPTH
jgi:hypothetical protein